MGANQTPSSLANPHLAADQSELYLTDPHNPSQEESVTGPLLGLVRTVRELERLAESAAETDPDQPVLALVDGSLVLWGLSGRGYRPFVRDAVIGQRLLPALEQLRVLSRSRPVALAAYVSLPRSTEVLNAVRICLCPHDLSRCRQSCGDRRSTVSPCDQANEFLDRDLFPNSAAAGLALPHLPDNLVSSREHYGENQQVFFYYLNGGEEIARWKSQAGSPWTRGCWA